MHRTILIFLFLLLIGCQVTPTPTPPPVSFPIIGTTPEFETTVISWVLAYRQQVSDDIIEVDTYSRQAILAKVQSGDVDLIITGSAPPEGWFVTPISNEPIVVVVNRANDIETLGIDELQQIFSGRAASWEVYSGSQFPLQPIVPLQGDSMRTEFAHSIMNEIPFSQGALLAPTQSSMIDLIEENKGAIGFLFQRDLNDRVKHISIDGFTTEGQLDHDAAVELSVDVLAMSIDEPVGILRDFVVWLQSGMDQ